MKSKVIVLFIAAATALSCKKSSPATSCISIICQNGGTCVNGKCSCLPGYTGIFCATPPAVIIDYGSIQFINNSGNPYTIVVNDGYNYTLYGNKSVTAKEPFGSYACQVIQNSGYSIYPIDEIFNVIVDSNNINPIISFP